LKPGGLPEPSPLTGALTAEAAMRDYEFTAKAIELLEAELISALKKIEPMTTEDFKRRTIERNDGVQKPLVSKPGLSQ
jgi:hypothetical protein